MKKKKIIGEKRKFCNGMFIAVNEELNDLYSSPNIVRVIKSRTM